MSSAAFTQQNANRQFGRAWWVTIRNRIPAGIPGGPPFTYDEVIQFGQRSWLPEGLHITFDTTQTLLQAYWFCDLVVYNLNKETLQSTITYGMQIKLEAGYQNGQFGTIFEGTVFQPMWEKENGVDWKLTLHCIVGMLESTNNFIGTTIAGGLTQRQLVAAMISQATYPLDVSDMDEFQIGLTVSRATTYFGQPNDFLTQVSSNNNSLLWFSEMAAHIRQLLVDERVATLQVSVETGMIGTPQQTQNGVLIKCLIQPNLILRQQVKLDQSTVIRQMERSLRSYPVILAQDGTYIIGMIRHYGDSRGNDWYTEITGFLNAGVLLALQTQL